ncbi:cell surface protein, partial [Lactiplantibacillus plantarum]
VVRATATITLNGTDENVVVNEQTTATTATFKNKVSGTTTDAPYYMITWDQRLYLKIRNSPYTVANGEDVIIRGIVAAEDSEQLTNGQVTLHPTLNGKEMPTVQMSDDDEQGYFYYKVKAEDLHVGDDNEIELWASDRYENVSPVDKAQIIVTAGELGFKTVAKSSTFNRD